MPIEPDRRQLEELAAAAASPADGPVVMLNLNRYRDRAAYAEAPPGGCDPEVSGRDAYARYGAVAARVLAEIDARILWHAGSDATVIGGEDDVYDEVIAVWYPSRRAFLALATHDEVVPALAHRVAGLERAALICCPSGPEPQLSGA